MELREIKALITLMDEHQLIELEIEDKKGKIRLVRGSRDNRGSVNFDGAPHPAPTVKLKRAQAHSAGPADRGASAKDPELAPNQVMVRSPMVGTFYRAASPEAPPIVEEGSPVRKGQALCIIEAMKMMNEVEAEASGVVVKILCENAQPVEYGQPLMIIAVE
jgi:acetyl-CoA carboxylase biotin carboxyl carrier protein